MISSERNPFSLRDTLRREHDEKYKHDNVKMFIIFTDLKLEITYFSYHCFH